MAKARWVAGRCLAIALLSLVLAPHAPAAGTGLETIAPGTLTACLPRNSGVIAGKRSTGGSGFDYRMMEEVATRLGLTLAPVWFETELEEESDPLRETYAMLSHGLCDVVPGHPRYVRAVGEPTFARANLPRWVGMPQEVNQDTGYLTDHRFGFVNVRPIAVSRGYMRSTIGLVHRDDIAAPQGLDDLAERPLAFQQGTVSGAIAMTQLHPGDLGRARHFDPGAGFLWQAETEGFPLAIVDVTAFDSYRKSNPSTHLRLAEWRHPFGMDIGVAVLEDNAPLLSALDRVLAEMMGDGTAQELATSEGLTYVPPRDPDLAPDITMRDLLAAP